MSAPPRLTLAVFNITDPVCDLSVKAQSYKLQIQFPTTGDSHAVSSLRDKRNQMAHVWREVRRVRQ